MVTPREDHPESMLAVARRLRLTRLAFRMNKATWSRFVQITESAWAQVEGTRHSPPRNRISLDQALQICRVTGVGLNWIYRGDRSDMPVKISQAMNEAEAAERDDPDAPADVIRLVRKP